MAKSLSQHIFKNSLAIYIGRAVNLGVVFIIFIHIANYLEAQLFGILSIALTFVATSDIISNFGINPIIVREISQNKVERSIILGYAIFFKLILSFLSILFCTSLANLLGYDAETQLMVIIVAFNLIISSKLSSLRSIFETPFQTDLIMIYPMVYSILDSLFFLVMIMVATQVFHVGLLGVVIVYTLSNLPGFLMLVFKFFQINQVKINIEKEYLKYLLLQMLPISAYVALSILNTKVDILMLSKFSGEEQVGLFSAAVRLVYPLMFFSTSFTLSLFPLLSQFYKKNDVTFNRIFSTGLKVISWLAIFISVTLFAHGDKIVGAVYIEDYSSAAASFKLLVIALSVNFFNFYFVDFFIAIRKQKYNAIVLSLALIFNVVLNLIVIPEYGFIGASYVRLGTAFLVCGLFIFIFLKKGIRVYHWGVGKKLLLLFVYGGAQIFFKDVNIYIIAVADVMIFLSLLFLFKEIGRKELSMMRGLLGLKKPGNV